MNYYSFHLGDYATRTAHLGELEDLALRRMLDLYYRSEAMLPKEWSSVARLIRMKDHGDVVQAVLAEFFQSTEEGWRNARCDDELARMRDKQQKASAAGKASGNVRSASVQRTFNGRSTDAQLPTPTPTPTPTPEKKTARKRAAPPALVSVSDMVAEGVDQQHATDWLVARKTKDLPLTPTAWEQTKAEAVKAGLTIGAAIQMVAANGWAGFKATWIASAEAPRGQSPAQVTTPSTDNRADDFLADQDRRAATATRPSAEVLKRLKRTPEEYG